MSNNPHLPKATVEGDVSNISGYDYLATFLIVLILLVGTFTISVAIEPSENVKKENVAKSESLPDDITLIKSTLGFILFTRIIR